MAPDFSLVYKLRCISRAIFWITMNILKHDKSWGVGTPKDQVVHRRWTLCCFKWYPSSFDQLLKLYVFQFANLDVQTETSILDDVYYWQLQCISWRHSNENYR